PAPRRWRSSPPWISSSTARRPWRTDACPATANRETVIPSSSRRDEASLAPGRPDAAVDPARGLGELQPPLGRKGGRGGRCHFGSPPSSQGETLPPRSRAA